MAVGRPRNIFISYYLYYLYLSKITMHALQKFYLKPASFLNGFVSYPCYFATLNLKGQFGAQ